MSKPVTPEQIALAGDEHSQQAAFFCWSALPEVRRAYPCLEFMFAIPNGGARDGRTGARLKAEGVKPGVPDVCLPYRNRQTGYAGLWIEFKVGDNTLTTEQRNFREYLEYAGYKIVICYTWKDAADAVIAYIKGERN